MANTQDESEITYRDGSVDILSQPDDHFTFKKLINPPNTEPSSLSGLIVNICTSILGEKLDESPRTIHVITDPAHHLVSLLVNFVFFPTRCFGVCLQCCSFSGRVCTLVSDCPLCYSGYLPGSNHYYMETATEQNQPCLQSECVSFC